MENHYKTFIKGTLAILLFGILSQVVAYTTRILFAKQLSIEEFGLFYAVLSLVTFLTAIQTLGMDSAMTVYVSKYLAKKQYSRLKKLINILISTKVAISLGIILILVLFNKFLSTSYFKSSDSQILLYLLSFYFLMIAFYGAFRSILRGYNKNLMFSAFDFLKSVLTLVVAILGFVLFKGVYAAGFGYALAALVTVIAMFFYLKKSVPYFSVKSKLPKKDSKKILNFSKSAFFHSLAGLILAQVDILMITLLSGLIAVAYYNAVLPVANLLMFFSGTLSFVLLTMGKKLLASKQTKILIEVVAGLRKYIIILVWLGAVLGMVYSQEILMTLFGLEYAISYKGLILYLFGVIFFALAMMNNQIIYVYEKPQIAAKILVYVALFNIAANSIMIPLFSMVGAIITTVLGFIIMYLFSDYYARKLLQPKNQPLVKLDSWRLYLVLGIYSIGFFAAKFFLVKGITMNIILTIFAVTMYLLLLYMFKIISVMELNKIFMYAKSIMRKK